MAYQVPARFVCWYIVQLDNKKLKVHQRESNPDTNGHTNCSRGIGPDRWTIGGHLEIPLSCHTYTTTLGTDCYPLVDNHLISYCQVVHNVSQNLEFAS
jgi:hypothetical protein